MSDKFQNKYRIASARLQKWDYAWAGAYFITICTHNRVHYFGEIENGKMILSNVGVLADVFWYELKNRISNIELGEFVVMPNHIHGILILNNPVETLHATSLTDTTPENDMETLRATSLQMSKISPKSNSISTIIRSYKSAVTKHANRLGLDFGWQSRFYDHIIRDEKSFGNISNYITNNPLNWNKDKFH
jgi:REP element-mobilizing transposase RayT